MILLNLPRAFFKQLVPAHHTLEIIQGPADAIESIAKAIGFMRVTWWGELGGGCE